MAPNLPPASEPLNPFPPEPGFLIDAKVPDATWKAMVAFAIQGAAAGSLLLIGRLGFHWPADAIYPVALFEVTLAYATAQYVIGLFNHAAVVANAQAGLGARLQTRRS